MVKEYKLDVPTKLEGITLRQYQDYLKVLDKWDKEDEVYIKTKMLQIFCNLNIEDTFKVPLNNFDFAIDTVNRCFDEKTPLVNRFEMSAKDEYGEETIVEFGFIPNFDKITTGEFVDLSKYGTDTETLHKLIAILFRPIENSDALKNYTIENYNGTEEYSELMKNTPINIVNGALLFFCSLAKELQKSTQRYMVEELKKAQKHQGTLKNGGGTQLSNV